MAKVIPLTCPDGVLYGFACAQCHRVCCGGSRGGQDRRTPANVAISLQEAERCCVCHGCGKVMSKWLDEPVLCKCKACREKESKPAKKRRNRP